MKSNMNSSLKQTHKLIEVLMQADDPMQTNKWRKAQTGSDVTTVQHRAAGYEGSMRASCQINPGKSALLDCSVSPLRKGETEGRR